MGTKPQWLINFRDKQNSRSRPEWLRKALDRARTPVEEDPAVVEQNQNKAQGDFTAELAAVLREHEGGRFGYDSWFGRGTSSGPVDPPKPPTQMTIDEVLEWQNTHNPAGPETTAIGAYQIVDQPNARTLSGLVRTMGLTGKEVFTAELQDRMAVQLMKGRGLDKFLAGEIDGDTFANKIAREWASMPVLKPDKRRGKSIAIGRSYYSGDGINKAFRSPKKFEEYKNIYSLADIGG